MENRRLELLKDNTYFDQTGKQILEGDLLKVYHFGTGNKTQYMYHVVVSEKILEGYSILSIKAHYADKPHCRLFVCCDKETRVYKTAKIIGMRDWHTKRKRIKITDNGK